MGTVESIPNILNEIHDQISENKKRYELNRIKEQKIADYKLNKLISFINSPIILFCLTFILAFLYLKGDFLKNLIYAIFIMVILYIIQVIYKDFYKNKELN